MSLSRAAANALAAPEDAIGERCVMSVGAQSLVFWTPPTTPVRIYSLGFHNSSRQRLAQACKFFAYLVRACHHQRVMLAVNEVLEPQEPPRKEEPSQRPPPQPELPLPRTLGRLVLLKQLARGGMGDVFLAASGAIDGAERPCVVKTIRRDHADDESFLARFLDEARIQSQLQHSGVVQVLEAATDEFGKPYVVVDFVEGRNLSELRLRAAQLNLRIGWEDAVAIAIGMGEGLAYIHECCDSNGKSLDIVHRDLSPQNVMLGYSGDVKLIDFGTARAENRRCRTVAGIVFAKPGYVAPEVANNTPGGIPADIYALGVMLWELCAGRRFLYGDPAQHMAAVGAGKRSPARLEKISGCPLELDNIIAKLTATLVEQRYSSARAAVVDLVQLLSSSTSFPPGESTTQARVRRIMSQLFAGEPQKTRSEFSDLVQRAKSLKLDSVQRPAEGFIEPSVSALLPGTRYRLARELGRGANGIVYEAFHVDLDQVFALKLLGPEACEEVEAKERLRSEAKLVFGFEHPNLAKVHDFGFSADGRPFFVMERLLGETLDKYLERKRGMDFREACQLGLQALSALEAAHERGLVHRDIKLQNLFLTEDGVLKLLDFGVAKATSEVTDAAEGTLHVVGTPETMSPEQARGQSGDARSDIYSLGAVLYELVTGHPTHRAESFAALLRAKCCKDALPIRERAPQRGLPRSLQKVLAQALERHPELRFSSAHAFRDALLDVLNRSQRSARRQRAVIVMAAAASLLGGAGLLAVQKMGPKWLEKARVEAFAQANNVEALTQAHVKGLAENFMAKVMGATDAPPGAKAISIAHRLTLKAASLPLERVSVPEAAPSPVAPNQGLSVPPPTAPEQVVPEAPKTEREASNPLLAQTAFQVELEQIAERLKRGNLVLALGEARTLAKKYPTEPRVLRAWSETGAKAKAWGEALRAARRWTAIDSSPDAERNLIRMLRAVGRTEEAAHHALGLGDAQTVSMLD